ncbi:hypothetical protein Tco_1437527 [Tanacetum coccineum]|uniref:Uncharacterized protein n=1 Tax=Tanacetum coccineum TaxID=301880 RepID=A0ABQ5FVJ6_9ASTR
MIKSSDRTSTPLVIAPVTNSISKLSSLVHTSSNQHESTTITTIYPEILHSSPSAKRVARLVSKRCLEVKRLITLLMFGLQLNPRSTDKLPLEEFDLKSALFKHKIRTKTANRKSANFHTSLPCFYGSLNRDEDAMG